MNPSPASAVQFCNMTPIIGVPGSGSQLPPNPSNPYPSPITVTGLAGTVTKVTVTLLNLTTRGDNNSPPEHWASDIDVMVTAPNNTAVVLMSDAGDDNDTTQGALSGVNLTFDDDAPQQLPGDTRLSSGTWRPVNDTDEGDQPDVWPNSPAPDGGGTMLSAFNGINPNGTWNLWAVDDTAQGAVDFLGGWCIDISTSGTGTTPTTTAPTTTTTAPTTTTTTPATTTTTPTTTTTTPTTTTTAPTTTTTAPTTTTTTTPGPGPGTCDGLMPTIVGTSGNDNIIGTAGRDVIVGGGGNDSITGLGGDDVICGGAGDDRLMGGDGDDRLFGEAGRDQLFGGPGNDTLNGGPDPDQCHGETGTDTASGCEAITGVP